ncbi:hypothetical protein L0F63_001697 [Massospora cicadina]|nr:hypothetical protein L0F63_001697 [Massospora cicadina]
MNFEGPTPRPAWFPQASPPLIDEKSLKQLYPKALELKQLIVLHRHGERTPLAPRFGGILPSSWNLCELGNQRISRLHTSGSFIQNSALSYRKLTEIFDLGQPHSKFVPNSIVEAATCTYGQLTDIGRRTLERNGQHLRRIYADHLNFLPLRLHDMPLDDLYLRTTDYPRTIESLQHLLLGLFPDLPKSRGLIFRTQTVTHDSLLADFNCKRIADLKRAHSVETHPSLSERWSGLRKDLIENTALGPALTSQEFTRPTAIHHVYDSLVCAFANWIPLPDGVTSKHLAALNSLEVQLWLGSFLATPELNRLGIGRLFSDLQANLASAIDPKVSRPKLAVYSGHDTTLAFGSMVMFELFKDGRMVSQTSPQLKEDTNAQGYYVRVKYNDKVLDLPHCKPSAYHHPKFGSTFCSLSALFDLFRKSIPNNYLEECRGFASEINDR